MSILTNSIESLYRFLKRTDRKITNSYDKANSWVFYKIRGGYKCSICGAKHLKFCNGEGTARVPHVDGHSTRMIISWYGEIGKTICPRCAFKAITEVFENSRSALTKRRKDIMCEDLQIGKCDFTGKLNTKVIGIIWGRDNSFGIDVRFGKEWWNGFHASLDAFEMAFNNLEMRSSFTKYIDGVPYYSTGKYIVKGSQTYEEFHNKNLKILLDGNYVQ